MKGLKEIMKGLKEIFVDKN